MSAIRGASGSFLWSGLRRLAFAAPLLGVVFPGALPGAANAQEPERAGTVGVEQLPDLVMGLRATPGCLGVEGAQTASGKQVIFAWFENKAAVLRWYYSEMHRGVQERFVPDRPPHIPLQHVPDDTGPILAIASITPSDSAHFAEATPLRISQIAIELYQPLPGGVFLGGRFAPDSVKVYGMKDYTPKRGASN